MEPQLRIGNNDNGQRLDAVLARVYPQYSRSFFQKFLKKGGVTLSGTPREPDYRVHVGESFQVADFDVFAQTPASEAWPDPGTDIEPAVVFEDKALLVIDKPAGLVVHPAPGHRVGTLTDWLKRHLGPKVLKVFTDPERLGLIHRLDKDTSGVLVIAKTIPAQTAISRQFRDRTVQKTYVAFVEGIPSAKTGVINAPVGRSRKVPTRMAISPLGRASETAFEVKETFKEVSLVTLQPKTGRTHQIRVHLSAIGHPIVGDRTYGSKSVWGQTYGIQRPLLHAEQLKLAHPTTGMPTVFQAPWPADFKKAQTVFRQAFKAILILAAVGTFGPGSLRAEEAGTRPAAAASKPAAPRKTGTMSADIRKLKAEVAAIQDELEQLKAGWERANVGSRLRDLERAALELNAKESASSATGEETKTQVLDIQRKLKTQQEIIEQLRDQVNRLQQQTAKQQAVEAPSSTSSASSPSPASSSSPSGSSGPRPWGSRPQ